jgi:hypothetical protein
MLTGWLFSGGSTTRPFTGAGVVAVGESVGELAGEAAGDGAGVAVGIGLAAAINAAKEINATSNVYVPSRRRMVPVRCMLLFQKKRDECYVRLCRLMCGKALPFRALVSFLFDFTYSRRSLE